MRETFYNLLRQLVNWLQNNTDDDYNFWSFLQLATIVIELQEQTEF